LIDDIGLDEVTVPEWGNAKFTIRALTMEETIKATRAATRTVKKGGKEVDEIDQLAMSRNLFHSAVVTPEFTPEQVEQLFKKNASAVARVVQAINKVNALGISKEDAVELENSF
jgi:hypothetical protein